VVVASVGAFLLGEWIEGATVSFLFAVANLLEAWSALRVRKSIEQFLDLTPQVADRIYEATGEAETVASSMVRKGDLLLVRPGGRIPVDGMVEQGCSHVNQSALTGEELPLFAEPGTAVLAGSANGEAALRVRATEDARHSLAARVKDAVLRAQSQRSQTERWVERFSRRYTPMVLAAAILVALVPALLGMNAQEWFYNALVLVLIACPCALVISTPVTMVSAITALARGGVLLRGGESVERAASVKVLAFDKTGVLTTGQLRVLETKVFPGADPLLALRSAAALERLSEHPVARAIVAEADQRGVPAVTAVQYRAIPGQGGEGIVDDTPVWVGSPRLAAARGAWNGDLAGGMEALGLSAGTLVCVGSGTQLWLAITLGDQPRPGAGAAIAGLRESGYSRLAMLTGDQEASATRIANAVGLTEVHANLLPEDKLNALRDLERQGGPAAIIGDGLNDAPAMAAAHFSIASGDRATNVTLEAADSVIWDGDLRRIPWLFAVCRQALAIVRQNVVFAIGSKLAFAVLAAFGVATLWMAVLADVGATIVVTFNGLRMLRAAQAPAMETSETFDPIKTSS
jgi:Cd2+/Zn2+-exporting ATPase